MGPTLLFAGVVAALGGHLWQLWWRQLRRRRAMRRWPRVPATVLGYRSELSRTSRRIDVQVRYDFDGRHRVVWCASPTRSGYGRGDLQASAQVAARFPKGTAHPVFVNPASPDEAFLELPELHVLALLAGGGTILVALAATLVAVDGLEVSEADATLAFMLLLGAVLAAIVVFMAAALFRLPRPRRRR